MKFLVLSLRESKTEFIKAQILTASSNCGASPARVAAASPPHSGKRLVVWTQFRPLPRKENHSSGQQCPVGAVKLNGHTRPAPFLYVTTNWKWAGWVRDFKQSRAGGFQLGVQGCLSANKKRKSYITARGLLQHDLINDQQLESESSEYEHCCKLQRHRLTDWSTAMKGW